MFLLFFCFRFGFSFFFAAVVFRRFFFETSFAALAVWQRGGKQGGGFGRQKETNEELMWLFQGE